MSYIKKIMIAAAGKDEDEKEQSKKLGRYKKVPEGVKPVAYWDWVHKPGHKPLPIPSSSTVPLPKRDPKYRLHYFFEEEDNEHYLVSFSPNLKPKGWEKFEVALFDLVEYDVEWMLGQLLIGGYKVKFDPALEHFFKENKVSYSVQEEDEEGNVTEKVVHRSKPIEINPHLRLKEGETRTTVNLELIALDERPYIASYVYHPPRTAGFTTVPAWGSPGTSTPQGLQRYYNQVAEQYPEVLKDEHHQYLEHKIGLKRPETEELMSPEERREEQSKVYERLAKGSGVRSYQGEVEVMVPETEVTSSFRQFIHPTGEYYKRVVHESLAEREYAVNKLKDPGAGGSQLEKTRNRWHRQAKSADAKVLKANKYLTALENKKSLPGLFFPCNEPEWYQKLLAQAHKLLPAARWAVWVKHTHGKNGLEPSKYLDLPEADFKGYVFHFKVNDEEWPNSPPEYTIYVGK